MMAKIKLSERDYFFLTSMHPRFKYIARDQRGMLWAFEREPTRSIDKWTLYWDYEMVKINSGLFMDVRWEDNKAYSVDELKAIGKEEYHVANR